MNSNATAQEAGRVAIDPLIINLAPTGMVPRRADSAHVPLTPDEIVADVLAAAEIGISIVHLHVRDDNGDPSSSPELYARVIGGIRTQRDDLVICVSCSGRGGISLEQRQAVLSLTGDLAPDMASLTLSSLNFATQASVNSPQTVTALAESMQQAGIMPELEIFDLGMANMAGYLLKRGVIKAPLYANLLFGNIASAQGRLLDIAALTSALPPDTVYSLAGIGAIQLSVAAIATAAAPGVRIGLEDNLWYDAARLRPATNQGLVERVHALAGALGRPVMTPNQARRLLGLRQR